MKRSIAFFLTICFCLMAFRSADACRKNNDCCCEAAPSCCKPVTTCCQPRRACGPRINRCCRQATCCDARVNCNRAVCCGPAGGIITGAVATEPVYYGTAPGCGCVGGVVTSGDEVPMYPGGGEVMESSNIIDGSSDVILEGTSPATESVPVDAPAEMAIPDAPAEG